ncbi:MAG: hypothetical protein HY690_00835 [Chloroflexi bacterium]|nr:hypothetical protein [Chloroflexota bacterium]
MKVCFRRSALILALCAWLLGAGAAFAQERGGIVISNGSPSPLLVDGVETQKLPTSVPAESEVCVPEERFYKSEGERWVFQKWSHGPTTRCVTLIRAGAYQPVYDHEVLVLVRSAATSFQRSAWVPFGRPLSLEVPETARVGEGEKSRYRFQQWSDGETPFQPRNTIAPVKPTNLEVKWLKEHLLTIEGPEFVQLAGSGWYADGSNFVLQAPDTVAGEVKEERWKFARWEGVGFPPPVIANPQNALAALKVDAPYTVRATYDRQYLVDARSPMGTLKREWLKEGQEVVLETPPLIEIVPERERYAFKRWEGMDGLLSPKVSGVVDRPVVVAAVYERQVMLKVDGPYGASGGGWQTDGTIVTVAVPQSVQQMLVLKSSFVGFPGYAAGQATVQVLVREPLALAAVYRTEVDLAVLGLLLLLPLVVVLLYFSDRWSPLLPRAWRSARWPSVRRGARARRPVEAADDTARGGLAGL